MISETTETETNTGRLTELMTSSNSRFLTLCDGEVGTF